MKSVRLLLAGAIDYAGLYPPATLCMDDAVRNYKAYRKSVHAWALGRFVVPLVRVEEAELPKELLSVTGPPGVEVGADVYHEATADSLSEVKRQGARAKIRTGGVTPEAFPSPQVLTSFLMECARLRLPFKATAGLHHAIRANHTLTCEPDSACATMHGFLNVFLAACLAWNGGSESAVLGTLSESDPAAFAFDDTGVSWHGNRVVNDQIAEAREHFIMSFGSCSFEEPLRDLEALSLL